MKISELITDDKNYNKGNDVGNALIKKSLKKHGAGRSILIDKNNKIIAGNKTIENASELGLDNVIVVETTGNDIIAVKRTDIDLNTKKGREMALADNASAKANITWDADTLKADWNTEELEDWGVGNYDWAKGIDANNMIDDDVDITEYFDAIGIKSDKFKLGLLFESKDDCETYISKNKIDVNKRGQIWTAVINSQSI